MPTQSSVPCESHQATGRSESAITYPKHLKICSSCIEHELFIHKERIKDLEKLEKLRHGKEVDEGGKGGQAELKREISLTKIPTGKYREVKDWPAGAFGDASVLLYSVDGAEFGIRRTENLDSQETRPADANQFLPANDSRRSVEGMNEDIPFRLVINSSELLDILNKITEDESILLNTVHVRPFKYLLTYEVKIRNALNGLRREMDKGQPPSLDSIKEASSEAAEGPESKEPTVPNMGGVPVTERNVSLLACLISFVDEQMQDLTSIRQQIAAGTLLDISFEYLLHLFRPGDLVFADPHLPSEERRAYRVLYVTGGRPVLESADERWQRLGKGREYLGQQERPHIGGLELLPDDFVSQGQQGKATKMSPLVIDCFYMDYDGYKYGPRPHRFIIPDFSGRKKIADLDISPARFDPACEDVRHKLRERGRNFMGCVDSTHKEYHSPVLSERLAIIDAHRAERNFFLYQTQAVMKSEVFQLDCECIIDQKATLDRYIPLSSEEFKGISDTNKLGFHGGVISRPTDSEMGEHFDRLKDKPDETDMYDDSKFDLNLRTQFVEHTALLTSSKDIKDEEQIELLPLRVFGYALQQRKWCAFNVLRLQDPPAMRSEERNKAFDDLVLPKEHRRSIRALVKYQVRDVPHEDNAPPSGKSKATKNIPESFDVINGKGQGLVLLFHGAPGVGKTSTAESVAIQLQRPLLPITCGDLGQSSMDVEQNLSNFFALGAKWRCVVLLDEADVFLARRITGDLSRNSLVSIFLRQVEYYSGVLILTTNRVGEFDEAFVSRIHMKLHFPTLDERSTMEVWDMNLRRLGEKSHIDIRSKAIRKFAEEYWKQNEAMPGRQWNGRQIKNAFQTAVALAYWDWEEANHTAVANGKAVKEKPVLRKSHFEDVAKTSMHFDDSMDRLYGAVGPDGKRRKGAYIREAERLRYRHDDRAQELAPQTQYVRGGVSTTAGRPAGATANASTLTLDDLQRHLDAMRAGTAGQPLSSATAGAGRDDASSSEDSNDDDSDED
ncbi:hypothetical protein KC360_g1160 [Hortaea werneckii]|nr:hypothetical protein KC325_g1820 [Hortaea werneckii]KAI6998510.1 hypothetical protein KC359_g2302 [Hortaea werneckii]KAI7149291.1 hypothetical protein KC344_g1174 [Hortaea werneckii]KAI7178997.1 hypothetical protein KC360_g1160 [Hortaea werneckii]